jgi:hypothetical protein
MLKSSKKKFLKENVLLKENEASFRILWNILYIKIKWLFNKDLMFNYNIPYAPSSVFLIIWIIFVP